jgi:predicted ATP-dependent serine protease
MHVNKDEDFAGLEKLKHLVGCTAILRCSDKKGSERRSLEVIKNRFGPGHSEVDLLMTAQGLMPTQEQVKAWEKERAIREANKAERK